MKRNSGNIKEFRQKNSYEKLVLQRTIIEINNLGGGINSTLYKETLGTTPALSDWRSERGTRA